MKILVIGSGGREHALVWKAAQSPRATAVWCAPGNAGIALERLARDGRPVECAPIGAEDLPRLLEFARQRHPDLTLVGPDNPLAMGIVDLFQSAGLRAWGPNRKAARFESSKVFAQQFMERHRIPTARAAAFSEPGPARAFAESLEGRCAVKADGLALGKGVRVCSSMAEAAEAIDDFLIRRVHGAAGGSVVIQEYLEGIEVSLHAMVDGRTALLFPTSQDHKQALDGDQGPNTGGMGAYCPTPFLDEAGIDRIQREIIRPWLDGCRSEGIDYRGILYPGLMLTRQGPKVLEFNARFGDPETQVYLARLDNDLIDLCEACLEGALDRQGLRWRPETAICVVMASAGYPGSYVKGRPIRGLTDAASWPNVKVFHAGTARAGDEMVTAGGRVLGVTAWAAGLEAAREIAYQAVERIRFDGAHYRRDIGARPRTQGQERMDPT
ncbi:MAG TPA: phosphoribosylamine--glycine ligase [Candidatus Paceibacterota bacterium]|nr:phosphoribosylamine--glycine ligase [Verrucomicrobiota bacterium]HRZ44138.1 phosphoribosylamine--glycine ligase [Candidatus Paceibacterota bacterium]